MLGFFASLRMTLFDIRSIALQNCLKAEEKTNGPHFEESSGPSGGDLLRLT